MTKSNGLKLGCAVLMLCAATADVARAQVFTVLADFDGSNGSGPTGTLAQAKTSYLYGTASAGGAYSEGAIFRIGGARTISLLYSFCSFADCGTDPQSGLILGSDGNFYGTTSTPYGTVFKVTPTGTLTTIHAFALFDGSEPSGNLVEGIDGNFYGTTAVGGATDAGTVFKISPEGTLTTLHAFCSEPNCADGSLPVQGVLQASDGNLYGTTTEDGAGREGTIFRITPTGEFTTLYSFCAQPGCADGAKPSVLVQAADGNIYGITEYGGNPSCDQPYSGCGTIFRMTTTGELATLYTFCSLIDCPDGSRPAGIMQATDGNFYGTTTYGGYVNCNSGCGTVFTITPTGELTTLQSFWTGSGYWPFAGLVQATNGEFYGITSVGGGANGTIFSLDMGLGPFVTFVQPFGKVGQTGGILGQGFTGTTSVLLNGTPASFTVVSDTFIKAAVPAGTTTGYVTVTTPTGLLTSNVPFHVIP